MPCFNLLIPIFRKVRSEAFICYRLVILDVENISLTISLKKLWQSFDYVVVSSWLSVISK